jgi:hypothetical protein
MNDTSPQNITFRSQKIESSLNDDNPIIWNWNDIDWVEIPHVELELEEQEEELVTLNKENLPNMDEKQEEELLTLNKENLPNMDENLHSFFEILLLNSSFGENNTTEQGVRIRESVILSHKTNLDLESMSFTITPVVNSGSRVQTQFHTVNGHHVFSFVGSIDMLLSSISRKKFDDIFKIVKTQAYLFFVRSRKARTIP